MTRFWLNNKGYRRYFSASGMVDTNFWYYLPVIMLCRTSFYPWRGFMFRAYFLCFWCGAALDFSDMRESTPAGDAKGAEV